MYKGRGLERIGHVWEEIKVIEIARDEEAFTKNQASFPLVLEVQDQGYNKVIIIMKLLWVC